MPEWCTGIPVLVRWAVIAVFCMAAIGFALCVSVCVGVHACAVSVCVTSLVTILQCSNW